MPLFQLKSQSQSCTLPDAAEDHSASSRLAQYRLGREAVYFPAFPGTRYLPFGAVSKVMARNTSMPLTGCCGKALPMICVRLFYDGEFYQDFMFENLKEANRLLDAVQAARPELDVERPASFVKAI